MKSTLERHIRMIFLKKEGLEMQVYTLTVIKCFAAS